MLAGDKPDYPQTFFISVELSGEIDRERFDKVLPQVLARHPMLQVKLEGELHQSTRKLRWVPLQNYEAPYVAWLRQGEKPNATVIDLHQEIALRIFIWEDSDKASILFQFHHACIDGVRAARFLEDLVAFYAAAGDKAKLAKLLRPIKSSMLEHRGKFHLSSKDWFRRWFIDLKELFEFLPRRPASLATGKYELSPLDFPATHTTELDSETLTALESMAKLKGVTLNDLLLRDLILTLSHANKDSSKEVAIVVPLSMERKISDLLMPAANITSGYIANASPDEIFDPEALLQEISDRSNYVQKNWIGLSAIRAIGVASKFSGGMQFLWKPPFWRKNVATSTFSFLSDPLRLSRLPRQNGKVMLAGITIEQITGIPLLFEHGPYLSFCGTIYAEQLSITLLYHPLHVQSEEAEQLLNDYKVRLIKSAQCITESEPQQTAEVA
ncbi:MAG: condensation domain-containing protein [Bdellovibrionota bacterium]